MLITPSDFKIKAVFSASGLSLARRCLHAWGLRYLRGLRRVELTWEEAKVLPVPEAKVKSKPTDEERKEKKHYNSLYRPALGKAVHALLETYYKGGDVDWFERPGVVALPGLEYLPHPDRCERVEAEGEITIEVDGVQFRGFRDLLVKRWQTVAVVEDGVEVQAPVPGGRWLLIDHKTTFTFDFFDKEKTLRTVKTPEQLQADPQAILYAFDVMRRECLSELDCRWVYYRTEDKPKALPVDFVITWDDAKNYVAKMVAEVKALAGHIGAARDGAIDIQALVDSLEKDPDACAGFGGCEMHFENGHGGDCHPPELTPGEKLVRLRTKQKARAALPPKPKTEPKVRVKTMGFRKPPAAAAEKAPAAEVEAPEPAESNEAPEEVGEAIDAGDAADEAPAPAPAPKAKPAKAKSGFVAAAEADADSVSVTAGGVVVEVPKSSPLFKAVQKVCKLRAAYDAALAGE
jgi:hypothetical protein